MKHEPELSLHLHFTPFQTKWKKKVGWERKREREDHTDIWPAVFSFFSVEDMWGGGWDGNMCSMMCIRIGVSSLLCLFICSAAHYFWLWGCLYCPAEGWACLAAKAAWKTLIPLTPSCIYISGEGSRASLSSVFCLCSALLSMEKLSLFSNHCLCLAALLRHLSCLIKIMCDNPQYIFQY